MLKKLKHDPVKVKAQNAKQKAKWQDFFARMKAGPCVDCGVSYPPVVMDFDHVRGEKLFDVSQAKRLCYSIEETVAEIAKCDLVCSNCHRLRTHNRRP